MAGFTHFTRPLRVGEDELVDDDVVRVDVTLGELLDQPLRLVQRQELSDAHTYEGGLLLIDAEKIQTITQPQLEKKAIRFKTNSAK